MTLKINIDKLDNLKEAKAFATIRGNPTYKYFQPMKDNRFLLWC